MRKLKIKPSLGMAIALLGLASLAQPVIAQTPPAPNPVFFVTTPDAVTGDNPITVWSGRINGVRCNSVADGCRIPDPNGDGPGGSQVDNYASDVYERPTGIGQGSSTAYYPQIDIVQSSVGYDDYWLYYEFDLYGGPLTEKYGFEINFDDDDAGDMFVEVDDPADKVVGDWASDHIQAYLDADGSVGGNDLLVAEGPGNINGYELKVYQTGNNQFPGQPGGDDVIVARTVGSTKLQLAVLRVFFNAVNGGNPVEKAAFRPLASVISFNEGAYYIHDEYSRQQIGSPYPWLKQAGAPGTCPTTNDSNLTPTQKSALDAGVDTVTVYLNPCFPGSTINGLDIGGTLDDFATPGLQFEVDLAMQKLASRDSVSLGDTLTYTLTAFNLTAGEGNASDVIVTDTLPSGLSLVSATPTAGACDPIPPGTLIVVCNLGTIANAGMESVAVVAQGETLGPVFNRAWVTANESDTIQVNDSSSVSGLVVYEGNTTVNQDGVDLLNRLPSVGTDTAYAYVFEASHSYSTDKDIELWAYSVGSGTVTIDSITGDFITAGATPDSATLVLRPRNNADTVKVWFTVQDVPRGTTEVIRLEGKVLDLPTDDEGFVDLAVITPGLDLTKLASVPTVGARPGTDITYNMSLFNNGTTDAFEVELVDELPAEVAFKLGSVSSTPPSGSTVTVFYSQFTAGTDWSYSPQSLGCSAPAGYDGCVKRIKWTLDTPLADSISVPTAVLLVSFVTRIN